MLKNRFLGIACNVPTETDGTLASYAWPGGYEIGYLMGDGSTLCSGCANDQIDRNMTDQIGNAALGELNPHMPSWRPSSDETIVGWWSGDQTDTCAECDNCGDVIGGSGCDPDENDVSEDCVIHSAIS